MHMFLKIVTKMKHVLIELTNTKPVCSDLQLGNGVSQETNESFGF